MNVTGGDDLGSLGERNVILWADHRAEKEAEEINGTGSVVLDYVGGKMSVSRRCLPQYPSRSTDTKQLRSLQLEMEIPKILWLKRRMNPELFERCQFFDLPDYLTYRATGSTARSCCSLTCKCSYVSVVEPKAGVDGAFCFQPPFHCSPLTSSVTIH